MENKNIEQHLIYRAAEQGSDLAQYLLGSMYEKGCGVRQDLAKAKEWFGRACDGGNQDGCDAYARLDRLTIKGETMGKE
ncbi:MAG: hypothetical protein SO257_07505 [Desulfovibrio sp.]|uniref:tetratricopeptide repeat protein n=1 Tax=Desulfovibrio sp. TaxID=885 RepID=UPI002A832D57|nr:hypothetical protein [Desulfovibrio sp.]MDY4807685.1 hypothetical protein [Desulfovibrio sp.]